LETHLQEYKAAFFKISAIRRRMKIGSYLFPADATLPFLSERSIFADFPKERYNLSTPLWEKFTNI
jgi:hypothetical protein